MGSAKGRGVMVNGEMMGKMINYILFTNFPPGRCGFGGIALEGSSVTFSPLTAFSSLAATEEKSLQRASTTFATTVRVENHR